MSRSRQWHRTDAKLQSVGSGNKNCIAACVFNRSLRCLQHTANLQRCRSTNETRNSSGDEIANVNFLTDDIVHALQNTIDSYINSATDRRRYVLERGFTNVSEITQCKAIRPFKVIQGHQFWYQSKAHIRLPISD